MFTQSDLDKAAKILSKQHKYGVHYGMRVSTLLKKMGAPYCNWDKSEYNKQEVAKILWNHKNIERGERALLQYVTDESLELRAEASRAQEERKRKEAELAETNWFGLQNVVRKEEKLELIEDDYKQRQNSYRVLFAEAYHVDFRVRDTIRIEVYGEFNEAGKEVRKAIGYTTHYLEVPNAEAVLPALEAFDTFVQTMLEVGGTF